MDRIISSIRNYNAQLNTLKPCKTCGQPATKNALFDVGNGIAVVERYCEHCTETLYKNETSGKNGEGRGCI